MSQRVSFVCDICEKEFSVRTDPNNPQSAPNAVGGMNGFAQRTVTGPDGTLQQVLMQYSHDFCVECNKKFVDYYFELGGK